MATTTLKKAKAILRFVPEENNETIEKKMGLLTVPTIGVKRDVLSKDIINNVALETAFKKDYVKLHNTFNYIKDTTASLEKLIEAVEKYQVYQQNKAKDSK